MKILLICAAAVVAVLAVGHEAINLVAKHELKAALASVPDANIHVRRVSHSLLAGSVKLRGIDISLPEVEVTFDRDPMVPYPAYLIQNLSMGMLRTVLPGGSVKKK